MEKATTLKAVRVTCGKFALDTKDREKFYVDTSEARGNNMLEELSILFDYVPEIRHQVLYLGHSGSGKSTVLYQLEQKLAESYKIIRFSVQEGLDAKGLDFIDLLFIMYERVLSVCSDVLNDTDEQERILRKIYRRWYATTEVETQNEDEAALAIDAEAGLGISTKIVNLFTKLSSAFKFSTVERTTIHTKFHNSIQDLIAEFNELADLVSNEQGKPILMMFEDLEKISAEAARDLFFNKGQHFKDIKVDMLLTTPIFIKYDVNFRNLILPYFSDYLRCPMIAISSPENQREPIGYETMKKIAYARIAEELIEDTVLESAISYSGGSIRDLLFMLKHAATHAELHERTVIEQQDIDKAFIKLQELICDGLRDTDIKMIRQVRENPRGLVIDSDSDSFIKLMGAEVIIEYNGEQWRGVHPAVMAHLTKHDLLQL